MESMTNEYIEERVITKIELPEDIYKTGDLLISRRWTGHTTEMMLLAGGFASHAAIIVRHPDSNDVFVAECSHSGTGEGAVKKTPISEWLAQAEKGHFEVVHLPIREELVKNSDLWTWVSRVEKSEYDYSLELFAAIDNADGYLVPFNS